jgi:hypothetical protein
LRRQSARPEEVDKFINDRKTNNSASPKDADENRS